MSDDLEEFSALGVAGALANSYARDTRNFLPLLGVLLEAALPEETEVERRGGLFQKNKPICKITVTAGQNIYTLDDPRRGPLIASRVKVVRGITLKTETIPVDQWLAEISHEIAQRAKGNENAFFALKELLD